MIFVCSHHPTHSKGALFSIYPRFWAMENQAVNRRINMITGHLASSDEIAATNLLRLSCSASLSSFAQRCDNRLTFARQGSSSQSYFMMPVSTGKTDSAVKSINSASEVSSEVSQGPLFSRPVMTPSLGVIQPVATVCRLTAADPPQFARPRRMTCRPNQENMYFSKDKGINRSPRMDVAESGRNFILRIEIPGVNIGNIRVEVDEHKLTVTSHRSGEYKMCSYSIGKISAYHKREISPWPCQEVVWPLPANVNKDSVSAEFRDGILRIIVPKV